MVDGIAGDLLEIPGKAAAVFEADPDGYFADGQIRGLQQKQRLA